MSKKELIIEEIRKIYDPELPVNIYELGLIYDIIVENEKSAKIKMTLTTPILSGKKGYEVSGEVLFEEKDLFELETEERAHKGIFLAFQYPLEIPGVNTNIFLKTSLNAVRKARGEKGLKS